MEKIEKGASKIKLMYLNHEIVKKADFEPQGAAEAEKCLLYLNDHIKWDNGTLADRFYYIDYVFKKERKILVGHNGSSMESNHPKFIQLIEAAEERQNKKY